MVNLIGENIQTILPIVFPSLHRISHSHWNRSAASQVVPFQAWESTQADSHTVCRQIHNLVFNALRLFMDINSQLFDEEAARYGDLRAQWVLYLGRMYRAPSH